MFVRNGSTWSQQQELTPKNGAAGDYFGASVSINGDTALVGEMGQGGSYIYSLPSK